MVLLLLLSLHHALYDKHSSAFLGLHSEILGFLVGWHLAVFAIAI
jgi:hypothetical protein